MMRVNSKSGFSDGIKSVGRKLLDVRELTILIILILFCGVLSLVSDSFLSLSNFRVIFTGASYDMIVCVAMAIALVGGQIDFSVGSILGISGFICSLLLLQGWNMWICILIALISGTLLGAVNGFIVNRLNIIPLVATMGTWMIYKGLGLALISNNTISNLPAEFKVIGQQWEVFGIPFSIIVMIVVGVFGWFALKYMPFFHQAFYIGENKDSAILAGINAKRFSYFSFAFNGLLSALAGVLLVSRFGSAPSTLGQGLEFKLVTAMLIGGVSFTGGGGSILGAFLGVVLMQIITNALAMFNVDSNLQNMFVGTILVVAVAIDEYNQRRKRGI